MPFIQLRQPTSSPSMLRLLIRNRYCILLNAFIAPIDMIMWFWMPFLKIYFEDIFPLSLCLHFIIFNEESIVVLILFLCTRLSFPSTCFLRFCFTHLHNLIIMWHGVVFCVTWCFGFELLEAVGLWFSSNLENFRLLLLYIFFLPLPFGDSMCTCMKSLEVVPQPTDDLVFVLFPISLPHPLPISYLLYVLHLIISIAMHLNSLTFTFVMCNLLIQATVFFISIILVSISGSSY